MRPLITSNSNHFMMATWEMRRPYWSLSWRIEYDRLFSEHAGSVMFKVRHNIPYLLLHE